MLYIVILKANHSNISSNLKVHRLTVVQEVFKVPCDIGDSELSLIDESQHWTQMLASPRATAGRRPVITGYVMDEAGPVLVKPCPIFNGKVLLGTDRYIKSTQRSFVISFWGPVVAKSAP